ncbi:hypothetical protein YC2023_038652 [Brassica napus]
MVDGRLRALRANYSDEMRPKCVENASLSKGIDILIWAFLGPRETSETELNNRARRFHDESQVEEEAHEEIEEEAQKDETEI